MKRLLGAILLAALCGGCATTVRQAPSTNYSLIDPKGVDMGRYDQDYRDCAELANQTDVADRTASNAAAGAVVGAAFGAIIGAIFCGRYCAQQGAAWGAGTGVVQGAVSGNGSAVNEQQGALRRCLIGRGYNVIR